MKSPSEVVFSDFRNASSLSNFRINADGTLDKREGYLHIENSVGNARGAYIKDDITYAVIGNDFGIIEGHTFAVVGTGDDFVFSSAEEKVTMFGYGDMVYIIGGSAYYSYCITDNVFSRVKPYVPLIMTNVDADGVGSTYEAYNMITRNRRISFKVSKGVMLYHFPERVSSIVSVYAPNGSYSTSSYRLSSDTEGSYIEFLSTHALDYVTTFTVEFETAETGTDKISEYLSNTEAYLYSDADENRLFLYGKSSGKNVYVSARPLSATATDGNFFDYFPETSFFSLSGDATNVRKIINLNNLILAVTSDSTHQILKNEAAGTNKIPFYSQLVTRSFYTTECSDVITIGDDCYSFTTAGLLSMSYSKLLDEYVVKPIEIPENVRPERSFYTMVHLHYNQIRDELWCCYSDTVAVYNMRHKLWYRFTGISAGNMFLSGGKTFFASNGTTYIFDEDSFSDGINGFEAVYEGTVYDLGNIFHEKTIYGFGVAIKQIPGAKLNCCLKNDKGEEITVEIEANDTQGVKKYVKRLRSRIGKSFYITLRMVSPAGSPPAHIKKIMFRYR